MAKNNRANSKWFKQNFKKLLRYSACNNDRPLLDEFVLCCLTVMNHALQGKHHSDVGSQCFIRPAS